MADSNGTALRKYREGNITAAFGTDLFIHGITFVPNMLLDFYPKMGLTESEVMLLIHLLRIRAQDKNLYPSREELGRCMSGGVEQVDRDLASLCENGVLAVTNYYLQDTQTVAEGFDFELLFERLSELWACSKVTEIERTKAVLETEEESELENPELGKLYEEFAGEFGRPLSPIEVEQIDRWQSEVGPLLAREALRRAVLLGKHNFKYIDSIILEWRKNRVRTLEEIAEYERDFQQRRNKKASRKSTANNREKEIALIKTLYMS
ncbi:MAG: DnaD domain protein [Desulforudis sp.]|nr:DnaD domain protein [Clostridia bacterium]RJX17362.1 MAG: DnaD domain protein [Desulforudis sp.]